MMARATVDLPQPDSPTTPCASPGISLRLKSTTAGTSPALVKYETQRLRHSRTGVCSLKASITFREWELRQGHQSLRLISRRPSASKLKPRIKLETDSAGISSM